LPLFEKARVEVYIPDSPRPAYRRLLKSLEREFTHTFGGCTILRAVNGSYLSRKGSLVRDRINLIYTDTPLSVREDFERFSRYGERLHFAAQNSLEEEAVLVVMFRVYHAIGS
jgi:hypothetical protein